MIVPQLETGGDGFLPMSRARGLVFVSEGGTALDEANVRSRVRRIMRRAGVAHCTPHDLRRTFASLLAARGVPTTRIRDYLGLSSVATTEGYYLARGQVDHDDVAALRLGLSVAAPEGSSAAAAQRA